MQAKTFVPKIALLIINSVPNVSHKAINYRAITVTKRFVHVQIELSVMKSEHSGFFMFTLRCVSATRCGSV